jgi:curved DNA-binding protein CbpA
MKRYFDVLGLPINADQQQIKKQYRKLAMRLHPDKNPSPEAKALFINITEAYNFLSAQTSNQPGLITDRKKEKTREDRIKEAQIRFYNQQQKEKEENERYFQSLFKGKKWQIIKTLAYPSCIISLLLILDFFLPTHFETRQIESVYSDSSSKNKSISRSLVTSDKQSFHIENSFLSVGKSSELITIEKTGLFHLPKFIYIQYENSISKYGLIFNFYWGLIPTSCVLFVPILVYYFRRKTVYYTIFYYIALYISPVLLCLFLFSDDHWAHLLTLGYL